VKMIRLQNPFPGFFTVIELGSGAADAAVLSPSLILVVYALKFKKMKWATATAII
jgi:hypothetical protein